MRCSFDSVFGAWLACTGSSSSKLSVSDVLCSDWSSLVACFSSWINSFSCDSSFDLMISVLPFPITSSTDGCMNCSLLVSSFSLSISTTLGVMLVFPDDKSPPPNASLTASSKL